MPHLLNVWPSASRLLRDAACVLLVSDFDGTLAPIAGRPEQAALPDSTRDILSQLSQRERFLVGIISGRSLADVSVRTGIPGLIYAGNHGLEIRGPGVEFVHPQAETIRETQRAVYQRLVEGLAHFPGVIVENKGLTLSLHYRMTPDEVVADVKSRFNSAMSSFLSAEEIKITSGKKVLEVRPNLDWDKGKAIVKLQEANPKVSLTVFFGDDLTDEDGFAIVQDGGGLAVFVGPARGPTCALHRLDSPEEVAQVLNLLLQL